MNAHGSACWICGQNDRLVEKRDHDGGALLVCSCCVGKLKECILCRGLTGCEWSVYTVEDTIAWGYYSPKSLQILREKRYALCETCPPDKVAA